MNRRPRGHDTGRARFGFVAVCGLALASSSCEPPAADTRSVKVARAGDTTYVAIEEHSNVRQNPECLRYCDRLADCWYAVSTGSVPLTHDEVRERCRAEQDDCRTKTTAAHCCGKLVDCMEFSECHARSNSEPAECAGYGAK